MTVTLARAVGVAAAVIALLVPASRAVADPNVAGDDDHDRFVGTGSLVLYSSSSAQGEAGMRTTPACPGCHWAALGSCRARPGSRLDDSFGLPCALADCAPGRRTLYVWLSQDDGAAWRRVGLTCASVSGPPTVADFADAVRERAAQAVPAGRIRTAPPRGVLPYVPVVFHSGQPAGMEPFAFALEGRAVTVYPVPRWSWSFGDGATLGTANPGSTYPDLSVSHAYRRAGPHTVSVRTTWTATFDIAGAGRFAVEQPVVQETSAVVSVGQARAVLVP